MKNMDTLGMNSVQKKVYDFFSTYPARMYEKSDVLIQAGSMPPVYFITQGIILQYDIARSGDKLVVNMYKPGAFISLASILNDLPSELFFEAANQVTVQVAPAAEVATFLRDNPDVTYDALARVSRGGNGLLLRLARAMEGGAEGRVLQELVTMQARFAMPNHGIKITEAELASQTGMARETINRALKRLATKGLLTARPGSITLTDTDHM